MSIIASGETGLTAQPASDNSSASQDKFSEEVKAKNKLGFNRRTVIKALLGIPAAYLGGKLLSHGQETADTVSFLANRNVQSEAERYQPENPEDILPVEITNALFEKLDLGHKFPQTLNKSSFHLLSQRIARLANFYFRTSPEADQSQQTKEFHHHCEKVFSRLLDLSLEMKVDFVGLLLTWQVSGANTSSWRAQDDDQRDERIRTLLSLGENVIGSAASHTVVSLMRRVNLQAYYAMARLEGPVTLGIHDIEIVMITRALKDLKESLPEEWEKLSKMLETFAPEFAQLHSSYTERFDQFQNLSNSITHEVTSSPEINEYLKKFIEPENAKAILTNDGTIDDYQFLRTTVFWAHICEIQTKTAISSYLSSGKELEDRALEATMADYQSGQPSSFYLDQICNPKFVTLLEEDAQKGNQIASRLLELSRQIDTEGDELIAADREIAAALVTEKTEQNLEFQLQTGVAYSRWLLQLAHKHTYGKPAQEIAFTDPNQAAYQAFLATANRETGPSYQLVGVRPLQRATLPFVEPTVMFETMDKYVGTVYSQFEGNGPDKDFRTFVRYLVAVLEEAYIPQLIGVSRYMLDGNNWMKQFIQASKKFGVYQNLFTVPHCSWMRSLEATIGYISAITEIPNKP